MMPAAAQPRRTSHASSDNSLIWLVVFALLALRVVNALTIQTFFQPDEYFQSLEPAWAITFGDGSGAWITWEWHEKLRSAVHPWLFAAVYRAADIVSATINQTPAARATVLINAVKLAQAVCAALMDLYTWKLARRVYGAQSSNHWAALALTVFSPWQWYCSTRTFSNSLETTITVIALSKWPWATFFEAGPVQEMSTVAKADQTAVDLNDLLQIEQPATENISPRGQSTALAPQDSAARISPLDQRALLTSLAAAALACILRPTNGIIWITVAALMLFKYPNAGTRSALISASLMAGSCVLVLSIAIDRMYYGKLTVPALNFFYFNVVKSLAAFYGRNRVDYYFTEGLPLLLIMALPFAVIGLWQALAPGYDRPQPAGFVERQTCYVLAITVLTTLLAFSLIGHKEVRFMYPILPILHVLAAKPLAAFFGPSPARSSKLRLGILIFGLAINVSIAGYVTLIHQRGVIDVMHFLRHEAETPSGNIRSITVGFLMPCHSTPWRSHLVHPQIEAWALTCDPPLTEAIRQKGGEYRDEADLFYDSPGFWLDHNMFNPNSVLRSPNHRAESMDLMRAGDKDWPEYLVFFEHLEPVMNSVMEDMRYQNCWRGFNTHWHDDGRRRGDVVVRCLR